ncbi:MAG: mandelate racemase/muconate lactonizing enzyme family protein, partial [Planctomycetota bacterium]
AMKVTAINALIHSLPFKRPFGIAGGTVSEAEHVVVKVSADDGTFGIGEAAPMPTYFPETAEEAARTLSERLAPAVMGLSPFDIDRAHQRMDEAFPGHTFGKAAIDVALFDLVGKRFGLTVVNFLGGAVRREVPLAWAVGTGAREAMVEEAARYARSGYGVIKVKIGTDPEQDLGNVRAIREVIGEGVGLRVDVNQGYDRRTAERILREMEECGLELVEQPLPKEDLEGLAALRERLEVPVMVDESLVTPEDALRIIEKGAADIFNIKVMRVGGLLPAMKIAHIAEGAGIPCLVGSMVEFGIGTVAGLHFALSLPNLPFACELIGPEMLAGDVIEKTECLAGCVKGFLTTPSGPGLGCTLIENLI